MEASQVDARGGESEALQRGLGKSSALGSTEVKVLLQLTPSIHRRASAFLSQPVAPASGRRQEAVNSHVNEHLDSRRRRRRIHFLTESLQSDKNKSISKSFTAH